MTGEPSLSIIVHVKDDTQMSASRIDSGGTDFASVKIGWQTSVLLTGSSQAKALAEAAMEAYSVLRQIETEVERDKILAMASANIAIERCTIDRPCSDCLSLEYPDFSDEPF